MRLISGKTATEDSFIDFDLRPKRLSEFVGQERIKDNLKIAILAAQKRGEPLDLSLIHISEPTRPY